MINGKCKKATKIEMIRFQLKVDVIISAFAQKLAETTGLEPARV